MPGRSVLRALLKSQWCQAFAPRGASVGASSAYRQLSDGHDLASAMPLWILILKLNLFDFALIFH